MAHEVEARGLQRTVQTTYSKRSKEVIFIEQFVEKNVLVWYALFLINGYTIPKRV